MNRIISIGSLWESKHFSKANGYGDTGRVKVYEVNENKVKTRSLTNPSRPYFETNHFLEIYQLLEVNLFGEVVER